MNYKQETYIPTPKSIPNLPKSKSILRKIPQIILIIAFGVGDFRVVEI